MPSTSPGGTYTQILPGEPTSSLQSTTTLLYRHTRYIVYISGCQLTFLSGPTNLVQVIAFKEELHAVLADESIGTIALISGKRDVFVLKPVTEGWSKTRWESSLVLRSDDSQDEVRCLGWGTDGEVLVGGSRQLSLFSTTPGSRTASPGVSTLDGQMLEQRQPLWSKKVASPLSHVRSSPDGGLIATTGLYDRLVKIWRRLSFEEGLFDHCYLSHSGVVTHLEWRPMDEHVEERRGSGISGRHDEDSEVLFTIASDGVLRVWRTGGLHDLEILALHKTVDLVGAIPESPSLSSKNGMTRPARYACVLPSDGFCSAITTTVNLQQGNGKNSHALEHLKEVATQTPDVVLTFDGHGRMSAWGLQSIGHKRRPETPNSKTLLHITHAEDLGVKITDCGNAVLASWFEQERFNLLVHDFSGTLSWWQGSTEAFFSPAASGKERLDCVAVWSGQKDRIEQMRLDHDGSALVSCDAGGKSTRWIIDPTTAQLVRSSTEVKDKRVEPPIPTFEFETGISDPSLVVANEELLALVSADGKNLVVAELTDGSIEHRQVLSGSAKHLALFSSAPGHNFLAVGYELHAKILVQDRYKQHHEQAAAWTPVKEMSMNGIGDRIQALEWLKDGRLVLAVGNGMMVTSNDVVTADLDPEIRGALDLETGQGQTVALPLLAHKLRAHLPAWHPGVLTHLVYHGKTTAATSLLYRLWSKLRFWSEGDALHPLLDTNIEALTNEMHDQQSSALDEGNMEELLEQLEEKDLPALSSTEQDRLKTTVKTLRYISEHGSGLDAFGIRYLFSWKFQLHVLSDVARAPIDKKNTNDRHISTTPDVPQMRWRDIAFAHHSSTQQALLDILTLHYDNKITWPIARALGLTAWLTDHTALAAVFEALAQSAYRGVDPPDPTNASLYFLALHKKTTLLGLWRIATWHKEQRATVAFLKRDFEQPEAKTAAKKNAYALLGRRRFEYAAAFFLLADDAASAIGVLASQCDDTMLAVAVARLYGTGIERLVTDRLLPQAVREGDRWYMSWCHFILSSPQEAASALVKPLQGVRMWWQDDPLSLLLYRHLRKSSSSEEEYMAVLRAARTLRRMGLWLIALDLVKTWEFVHAPSSLNGAKQRNGGVATAATNGVSRTEEKEQETLPSVLDSFSSSPAREPLQQDTRPSLLDSFVAPPPVNDEKAAREANAAELLAKLRAKKSGNTDKDDAKDGTNGKAKRAPTQFKEPDADSLLDSFGF